METHVKVLAILCLAIPLIRLGGTAAAVFCFVWAVMSALSLMHVPFGTALGIYGLWILFNRDTERLFAAHV